MPERLTLATGRLSFLNSQDWTRTGGGVVPPPRCARTLAGARAGLPAGLGGRWAWSSSALSAGEKACFPSGEMPRARRSQRTRQAQGGARGSRALTGTHPVSRALRAGRVPEHTRGTQPQPSRVCPPQGVLFSQNQDSRPSPLECQAEPSAQRCRHLGKRNH